MPHPSRKALDYPNINDACWIIWWGNEHLWPHARRETRYMHRSKTDASKGYAIMTIFWQEAALFDTECKAREFLEANQKLRGHAYHAIQVTTVAVLKQKRGYA